MWPGGGRTEAERRSNGCRAQPGTGRKQVGRRPPFGQHLTRTESAHHPLRTTHATAELRGAERDRRLHQPVTVCALVLVKLATFSVWGGRHIH